MLPMHEIRHSRKLLQTRSMQILPTQVETFPCQTVTPTPRSGDLTCLNLTISGARRVSEELSARKRDRSSLLLTLEHISDLPPDRQSESMYVSEESDDQYQRSVRHFKDLPPPSALRLQLFSPATFLEVLTHPSKAPTLPGPKYRSPKLNPVSSPNPNPSSPTFLPNLSTDPKSNEKKEEVVVVVVDVDVEDDRS